MINDKVYTIEEIKDRIINILNKFPIEKAILFGSYAQKKQTEKSDIDIVIDSNGKLLNINFYGLLEELVQCLDKEIDLFEISEIEKESDLYQKIQKEGVTIYER